jgi:DNA-binding response OmpR family regulator
MSDVLLLDDDELLRDVVLWTLSQHGVSAMGTGDPEVALGLLDEAPPARVMLCDLSMSGAVSPARVARRALGAGMAVVLASARADLAEIAADLGATGWLRKPFGADELLAAVRAADHEVAAPNAALSSVFECTPSLR